LSADNRQPHVRRAIALQSHICQRPVDLPCTVQELVWRMQSQLTGVCDDGLLRTKKAEIQALLKPGKSRLASGPEYVGIYGGEKDFHRSGKNPRFIRDDGAWFVFTITVRHRAKEPLLLIAYDFEICFPEPMPRFVRLDLNQPEHPNEEPGLRCHVHPGHDDLRLPAPLMTPIEVLDLFTRGLRPRDKLRAA
jgi:hypothetical protein